MEIFSDPGKSRNLESPGHETKRNVGDNKPNHYGYDNAAKDPS